MAYAVLAKPGTTLGPCAESCQHTDCAQTRQMAASLCSYCQYPIGYATPFCKDPDDEEVFIHTACLYEREETDE